ncbi:glycoside hydrolase family 15 protein [Natrarchaeobius halalkaliphilus]|uniref:Glycoside hydrolase family 15 protein n=1 Tax=Natrarchaeobius halalkaliphilus TaxID=1679091 RepID=A0A3N6M3D1_9EURY|nr:glycoside hydrolase family 15 protein [Natrarchaeobius halalkaliphilus]RQG86203.1 glycoside hydrolase family 15 protein [Natrarchaeobius halalkaliphilus]
MDYPPLRDYGIIGNDDRCALVSRFGSVDWCCFPHLESESVFAAILDADRGGHFAIEPNTEYDSTQRYVDRTNVLETVFETGRGRATVTDFMPIYAQNEPGDDRFQQSIYRRLECGEGSVDLTVSFDPRFDYARAETILESRSTGIRARRDGDDRRQDDDPDENDPTDEQLFLTGDCEFSIDRSRSFVEGTVSLSAGDRQWVCLQYGGREPLSTVDYESVLEGTTRYWRDWLGGRDGERSSIPERWREIVVRSELLLKLLIHHDTGAIPAAATTSIPEAIGSDRTWDYRFNWIRDAKFSVQALHDTGHRREAREYFDWFVDIARRGPEEIVPLYGLHGETGSGIDEQTLDHLSGYRGTRPVRIGNAAATQKQLDVYGTIVQAIYETVQFGSETGVGESWDAVCDIVDYVCDHWDERDAGIWEFRDEHRHFLHSKLLCWVALDRGIALARDNGLEAPTDRWHENRLAVREAIEERGYSESASSFVQHFDTDQAIDATVLLIPIYEFLPPEDERVQSTIDAVIERLTTDDGLVVRFVDTDVREDEREAFLLCSFWLVDALVLSNRLERAREYFECVLEYANPLGLYSEKVDPGTGQLLGNFPQAFSHLGLINSVTYLARALEANGGVEPNDFRPSNVEALFRRESGSDAGRSN